MSEIRNLLASAQAAEVRGDKTHASELLRKAAAWYRDRQMPSRAAQMLRQARRVEGVADEPELELVPTPDDTPPSEPAPSDPFGFGDDFEGETAKSLEQRTPQLADPNADAWCSFCCRPQSEVGQLVAGPAGAFICAACTRLSRELRDGPASPVATHAPTSPQPATLRALEHELPAQRRARERFVRLRPRLSLVIGPSGSGKTAWLQSMAHADHRLVEAKPGLDHHALFSWLEQPHRSATLVATAPPPAPALTLQGEHGPEPLHDTRSLHEALPHLPRELIGRIDAVHVFDEPDAEALHALARHLAEKRGVVLPEAVLARLVGLALEGKTSAHELVTLLARIPPGTYR